MLYANEAELAKSIRAGEISTLYYFYGSDIASIEAYTKKLVSKLVKKDEQTYNLHSFDGKSLDLSVLSDVCEALPMFSDRVYITINDLDADELNQDDFDYLCGILSNVQDTTTVIINITGISLLNNKNKLKPKNNKLISFITKIGSVCNFTDKKPAELVKLITDTVNKKGATISKKSSEYLASQCLSNINLINNEIDKLCDYVSNGEITNETIDLLVAKQLDSNSFALAKAVVQFDAKRAMQLLDELFEQRIETVMIISAISMSFIDLYRARVAINEGISQNEVAKDFSYTRDFALKNAFRECKNIPAERLRDCIAILADTDIAVKSTRTSQRLLIEKAIHAMLIK